MLNAILRRLPTDEDRAPTREEVAAHGTEIYEVEELLDFDINLLVRLVAEKSDAYIFYDSRINFKGLVIFILIAVGDQIEQARARSAIQELSDVAEDMLRRSRLCRMYTSGYPKYGLRQ